jgi:hypothetical protein
LQQQEAVEGEKHATSIFPKVVQGDIRCETSIYKRQSQMHLRDLRDVVDLFEIKLPWQLKLIVLQFAGLVHVGKRRRCLSWVVYS